MNGEGVAQVMQARLTVSAIDPFDTRIFAQAFEAPFDEWSLYWSAAAQDEEGRFISLHVSLVRL